VLANRRDKEQRREKKLRAGGQTGQAALELLRRERDTLAGEIAA